jgi:hypothetical protein
MSNPSPINLTELSESLISPTNASEVSSDALPSSRRGSYKSSHGVDTDKVKEKIFERRKSNPANKVNSYGNKVRRERIGGGWRGRGGGLSGGVRVRFTTLRKAGLPLPISPLFFLSPLLPPYNQPSTPSRVSSQLVKFRLHKERKMEVGVDSEEKYDIMRQLGRGAFGSVQVRRCEGEERSDE